MLTDRGLIREMPGEMGGTHRVYELGKNYFLSAVNSPLIHSYPFAWEIAVIREMEIVYDTPLTDDVEIFMSDDDANAFIEKAFAWVESMSVSA